jgi:hypothetical protein
MAQRFLWITKVQIMISTFKVKNGISNHYFTQNVEKLQDQKFKLLLLHLLRKGKKTFFDIKRNVQGIANLRDEQ